MARFHGTGVVQSLTWPRALGALGVAARASGLGLDLRRDRPYAAYDELDGRASSPPRPATSRRASTSAPRRRTSRSGSSARPLAGCPRADRACLSQRHPPSGDSALGAAEGPRGASWIWLRAGVDGTIDRLRLRSASFANWPVVAAAVPGNLVPDFPLINKSFELCYACTDR